MHFTIHLTTRCNFRCGYCYSTPCDNMEMTEETMRQTVRIAGELDKVNPGIIFFGGEPLLRKDLIKIGIDEAREISRKTGVPFHFKVTTNGWLMDEEFLELCKDNRMTVGLSLDGISTAHDYHRKTAAGEQTHHVLEERAKTLLKYQPYAPCLMTVTPETLPWYAESVAYLTDLGFRYLNVSLNYAGDWTDDHLVELKKQYLQLSKWYEKETLADRKFYFGPFEVKLSTWIQGEDAHCQRCLFAQRQVSVAPDGAIYPCVQFVRDGTSLRNYIIGDVWKGLDSDKQNTLFQQSQEDQEPCLSCPVKKRCNHRCSCLNFQTTGDINQISPFLCESERLLIPIADNLGERLYQQKSPRFIQKHYNAVYPLLSFLEDQNPS